MQRLTELTAAQTNLLEQEIRIYKQIRGLIRDGKIFHLMEPRDESTNDAIESFSALLDSGVIFVYRPNSADSVQLVYPKGLQPDNLYEVVFQNSGQRLMRTGASLMQRGLKVLLPQKNSAEIVHLNGQPR